MNKYISKEEREKLSRRIHDIPDFITHAMRKAGVEKKYEERPAYQKNDYVGWIIQPKKPETQQKRLEQMIEELKEGKKYMKMNYGG